MDRRDFIASAGVAGLAASTAIGRTARVSQEQTQFSMKFAPHFGMFQNLAGGDHVSQLEFAADQGFSAWEDNGMAGRSIEDQNRIAAAMDRLGMTMGVFVLNMGTAWGPHFSRDNNDDREKFVREAKAAVDVAKRVNAKWTTVVLGTREPRIPLGYQTAYAVDMLRRACEILEPHSIVMVLEPLNPRDHPNMLLAEMAHAFEICRAVNSPSCKILCDLYHQSATEGNLIDNLNRSWEEIAYFQIGDNPGRREPTTGEINYLNVFKRIKDRGFTGVLGMEHGNANPGKAGEQAVIDAYRSCDPS
ncbi:MAG: TIM barrel protein [Phycisphaerales bacterium]